LHFDQQTNFGHGLNFLLTLKLKRSCVLNLEKGQLLMLIYSLQFFVIMMRVLTLLFVLD